MASRPSRESGKTWHRAKGSKDQRLLESAEPDSNRLSERRREGQRYGWSAGCAERYLSGAGSAGRKPPVERRQGAVLRLHHLLAYITGTVDQELLLRNEYLVTENRILRNHLKGRIRLSDGERKN